MKEDAYNDSSEVKEHFQEKLPELLEHIARVSPIKVPSVDEIIVLDDISKEKGPAIEAIDDKVIRIFHHDERPADMELGMLKIVTNLCDNKNYGVHEKIEELEKSKMTINFAKESVGKKYKILSSRSEKKMKRLLTSEVDVSNTVLFDLLCMYESHGVYMQLTKVFNNISSWEQSAFKMVRKDVNKLHLGVGKKIKKYMRGMDLVGFVYDKKLDPGLMYDYIPDKSEREDPSSFLDRISR